MESMRKNIIVMVVILLNLLFPKVAFGQEETSYKAIIKSGVQVPCSDSFEETYTCYEYTVEVVDLEEEKTTMPLLSESKEPKFKEGDRVYVTHMSDEFGNDAWSISGYDRNSPILLLVIIFSVIAILIGKRQGIGSLISLIFTVIILYTWAIPKILSGSDVVFIGVLTVVVTLVVIMYASHGFNRKSSIAIISTMMGIALVGILAKIFSNLIKVDGSGSEEAAFLLSQTGGSINLSEVFFVSILIGAMGILDDVVMSQVSSIQEIYRANSRLSTLELYRQGMNIGRDHISSMVNTLFIAYAGSSLAVVMLLTYNSGGIGNILNTDFIAEEIVRAVTSSIGILLVVPISTLIAAKLIPLSKN